MIVRRQKDKWGESFATEVNGVKIFSMGADYIPEDNILSRVNPKRTRRLLEQCVAANFNSIRIWGGGHYPPDYFYDICDELGLVVWQDFMFACAVYDLTDDFDENIRAELADNIKRIRHHASLGLWCGNNEIEGFAAHMRWVDTLKQKADYIKMFEYIFPQMVKELDPETFYWPSRPSSGGSFDEPNDPNRGDVHYWDVWHGNKPFSEYRKSFFSFLVRIRLPVVPGP
jgi:beta-mannosidase